MLRHRQQALRPSPPTAHEFQLIDVTDSPEESDADSESAAEFAHDGFADWSETFFTTRSNRCWLAPDGSIVTIT